MASPSLPSDADLVQAIREGDLAAFETLYDRYQDWIVSLAYRFSGHREDALDVLQETFTYFFRKFPGFELRSRLKTFFYPVVKHLALARRQTSRRRAILDREPDVAARASGAIDDLLAGLSEAHREVVLMRFADGMDLQSIADALGIPLGTVKSRLHTALGTLRTTLPGP